MYNSNRDCDEFRASENIGANPDQREMQVPVCASNVRQCSKALLLLANNS